MMGATITAMSAPPWRTPDFSFPSSERLSNSHSPGPCRPWSRSRSRRPSPRALVLPAAGHARLRVDVAAAVGAHALLAALLDDLGDAAGTLHAVEELRPDDVAGDVVVVLQVASQLLLMHLPSTRPPPLIPAPRDPRGQHAFDALGVGPAVDGGDAVALATHVVEGVHRARLRGARAPDRVAVLALSVSAALAHRENQHGVNDSRAVVGGEGVVDALAVAAAHRLVRGPVARFEALVERGGPGVCRVRRQRRHLARAVGGKVVDLRDAVGALVLLRPDGGAAALAELAGVAKDFGLGSWRTRR